MIALISCIVAGMLLATVAAIAACMLSSMISQDLDDVPFN